MYRLVIVRHGQSEWNLENRFTGWTDVGLSEKGRQEAKRAGELLKEDEFEFDLVYTSVLKRSIDTANIILEVMRQKDVEQIRSWKLNERHYGALQGLNKAETMEKHGEKQVQVWRRSYDVAPPPLEENDDRYNPADPNYAVLNKGEYPATESLKDTVARVIPYWENEIIPQLKANKSVLIVAHGNSLRALVMYLEGYSEDEVTRLNIPTGEPLFFTLNDKFKSVGSRYLGDDDAEDAALLSAKQSGAKTE